MLKKYKVKEMFYARYCCSTVPLSALHHDFLQVQILQCSFSPASDHWKMLGTEQPKYQQKIHHPSWILWLNSWNKSLPQYAESQDKMYVDKLALMHKNVAFWTITTIKVVKLKPGLKAMLAISTSSDWTPCSLDTADCY